MATEIETPVSILPSFRVNADDLREAQMVAGKLMRFPLMHEEVQALFKLMGAAEDLAKRLESGTA